jgi:hypothetical protein
LSVVSVAWIVYLTGNGSAFLFSFWGLLPEPLWFMMEGVVLLLPAVGIILVASIAVWLARQVGDERLERQTREARWLMPLIIILFIAASGSLELHFEQYTAVFLSIPLQVVLAMVWIVVWLRVLMNVARLLKKLVSHQQL